MPVDQVRRNRAGGSSIPPSSTAPTNGHLPGLLHQVVGRLASPGSWRQGADQGFAEVKDGGVPPPSVEVVLTSLQLSDGGDKIWRSEGGKWADTTMDRDYRALRWGRSVARTPVAQLRYGAGVIECLERHPGGVVIRVIGRAFGARGAGGVTRIRGAQRRRRRWLRAQAQSLEIDRRVRRSSCTRTESMDPWRLVRVPATPRRR